MLEITLGWPPSVNHYWKQRWGHGFYISKRGVDYRQQVLMSCKYITDCFKGPIELNILAYPPDRRVRDLDNLLKVPLDCLAHAKIYENDSQISKIIIERKDIMKGGQLNVIIKPYVT